MQATCWIDFKILKVSHLVLKPKITKDYITDMAKFLVGQSTLGVTSSFRCP